MNHAVAVDASVAVKWVVAEQFTDRAQALLNDSVRAGRPIVTPPHFSGEVINAIYRQRRRMMQPLSQERAEAAVRTFLAYPTQILTPTDLYWQAYTFAETHNLSTVYDSLYVVLAQITNTDLWTADQRLLNALGSRAPWVRFIGGYPPAWRASPRRM